MNDFKHWLESLALIILTVCIMNMAGCFASKDEGAERFEFTGVEYDFGYGYPMKEYIDTETGIYYLYSPHYGITIFPKEVEETEDK